MRLTDDELRDVLARAEEIQHASRHGPAWNAEVAAVISAAEEVGLSRRAVELALSERLNLPAAPPSVGSLAWARSKDGKFYVAEVLAIVDEGARVRFLGGSEYRLPLDQLRPCAFIPGERIVCNWPWWGPWTCTVCRVRCGRRTREAVRWMGRHKDFSHLGGLAGSRKGQTKRGSTTCLRDSYRSRRRCRRTYWLNHHCAAASLRVEFRWTILVSRQCDTPFS